MRVTLYGCQGKPAGTMRVPAAQATENLFIILK